MDQSMGRAADQAAIRRSLSISWKEGIPAAIMQGILDYYLIPYGLFLGATAQQIGWLVSVPHVLAAVALLASVWVVRQLGSRRRFLVRGVAWQAASLLPVAALAWWDSPWRFPVLVLCLVVFRSLANLLGPAWGSLMSEYLAPEERGRYFGFRSQVVGLAGVAGIAAAGWWLHAMESVNPVWGFGLLFAVAGVLRASCVPMLRRMEDLPLRSTPTSDFTFLMFLSRARQSNFVRFVLYVAGITFATHLAAPYFSVYMIRDLEFSYVKYMAVHLMSVLAGLVAVPLWGRHADVVGNAKILKVTGALVPLIPILWLLGRHPAYLIVIECVSGVIWAGFNLCTTNFVYEAVTPEKRVRCLGYFNMINGVALFGGALLGGWMADRLPSLMGVPMLTLFLLSGVLRATASFSLVKGFREIRPKYTKVSSMDLFFSVVGIRSIAGRDREFNSLTLWRQREQR